GRDQSAKPCAIIGVSAESCRKSSAALAGAWPSSSQSHLPATSEANAQKALEQRGTDRCPSVTQRSPWIRCAPPGLGVSRSGQQASGSPAESLRACLQCLVSRLNSDRPACPPLQSLQNFGQAHARPFFSRIMPAAQAIIGFPMHSFHNSGYARPL